MRLTLARLEKILPTNRKRYPKSSFRRPMQGRYTDRKKEFRNWDTSLGEIDEEVMTASGRLIPVREKVPMIMVPDLKDCQLKPYVSYKVEKHKEPPITSKELFDLFYAPSIQAEVTGIALEEVPDVKSKASLVGRVKSLFKSEEPKPEEKRES